MDRIQMSKWYTVKNMISCLSHFVEKEEKSGIWITAFIIIWCSQQEHFSQHLVLQVPLLPQLMSSAEVLACRFSHIFLCFFFYFVFLFDHQYIILIHMHGISIIILPIRNLENTVFFYQLQGIGMLIEGIFGSLVGTTASV